jgi:hypothetical protein
MKYANYIILLVLSSLVFRCTQGENDKDVTNGAEQIETISAEEKALLQFEKCKKQVAAFYNDAGFEIIDHILKYRVYEQNPQQRSKLNNVALNDFPSNLDKEVETNVKIYAEKLIDFKNQSINNLEYQTIEDNFSESKEILLASTFYRDTIIGKWKDDDRYIELEKTINEIYEVAQSNLKSPAGTIVYASAPVIETTKDIVDTNIIEDNVNEINFSKFIENYKWWLLGLLVISLLLNLFQFLKLKKTKKGLKKGYENKLKKLERTLGNNTQISSNNNSNNNKFKKQATHLSSGEVKESIDLEYKKLQQFLASAYHKDCVLSIEGKFENLKSQAIDFARSKSISTKDDLSSFIHKHIEQNKVLLRNELDNCVPKEQALLVIHNEVVVDAFAKTVNTNIVSEEDIAAKVNQLKDLTISELPTTILKPQLSNQITRLKNEITQVLQQMVKDNLVYYFAFADTNGALNDTKKTKTIQRDSAIKLSVNPDDLTKASFKLLLEKEDMMKAGIMSYDSFLIPICELKSENFNSTGTQITQIGSDGTMELENGIWKVKNKLPIKVI